MLEEDNEENVNLLKEEIASNTKKIVDLKKRNESCMDEIFKLRGLIYICPTCWGSGKIEIGHSFRDRPIYGGTCSTCKGVGRTRIGRHRVHPIINKQE